MLVIEIKEIKCLAKIGVYDWEQNIKQPLLISTYIKLSSYKSSESDNLMDTLDYETIQNSIINIAESKSYALIETVAGDIVKYLKNNALIDEVLVTVEKPTALNKSKTVKVHYGDLNIKSI